MPRYPNLVDERLNAPPGQRSMCWVCPLNGKRKVGHDGPLDAEYIAIFEAPGKDEEDWHVSKGEKYGRPLVGKTGYFVKLRNLAPAGLVELLPGRNPQYPRVGRLKVHLANTIMCCPPKNKIDSPEGKKAARCCANGLKYIVNRLLRENPNRTLIPAGGTSLSVLRGKKTSIEAYRGRPTGPYTALQFPYEPEEKIIKDVLRGQKPREVWWPYVEKWLKTFVKFYRSVDRALLRQQKKMSDASQLASLPWLVAWEKEWKKQRTKYRKEMKKNESNP